MGIKRKRGPDFFEDIASSRPFRFVVGPEGREFTIHASILRRVSPVFERMVFGCFSEADDGLAVLKSVDVSTFIRFIQFAYTEDYGEEDDDDTDKLLEHARVFVFADCYDVAGLKEKALRRFSRALRWSRDPKGNGALLNAVRFCFVEDVPPKLRDYVAVFMARKFKKVWADEDFRKLIANSVDLAVALLGAIHDNSDNLTDLILKPKDLLADHGGWWA